MTDTMTPPKATPTAEELKVINQTRFENLPIWLPRFAMTHYNADRPVVEDKVFENCAIAGPGVILALGGTHLESCDLGYAEDIRSMLVRGVGPRIIGAVGFANCRFIRCRFAMIGFTGPESFIETFLSQVKGMGEPA